MSRCFPYPPPGFSGKTASNEALILSIKNEKEKAVTDRKKDKKLEKKERKQEKKDKKQEKKERKLEKEKIKATELNENGKRKLPSEENNPMQGGKCGKWTEDGYPSSNKLVAPSEQLEKSSVTEEHGKPCTSSDSTENSGKRKRDAIAAPNQPTSNQTSGTGTVIRFKFSSQKKENPVASLPVNNPCSTSGRPAGVFSKAELKINSSNPAVPSLSQKSVGIAGVPQKVDPKIIDSGLSVKPPQQLSSGRAVVVPQKRVTKISKSHIPVTPPCSTSGSRSASLSQKYEPKINSVPQPAVQVAKKNDTKMNSVKAAAVAQSSVPKANLPTSGKATIVPQKSQQKVNNLHLPAIPLVSPSTSGKATDVARVELEPEINISKQVLSAPVVHVKSPLPLAVDPVPSAKTGQTPKQTNNSKSQEEVKKPPRALRKLVKLMDNLVPPPPVHELSDELDEDWLFGGGKEAKRVKSCKEAVSPSCEVSFPLQPMAQYLSEAGIYALPYTVPY